MEDILYQLFDGDYDITPERDKTQQELSNTILLELNKIADILGTEFVDHLCAMRGAQEDWYNYQYYRAGFILGARLMLEALG